MSTQYRYECCKTCILNSFNGNMFVIKDESDHFEEKFANLQIFLLKRSDLDPVELFCIEIRIRLGLTVPLHTAF